MAEVRQRWIDAPARLARGLSSTLTAKYLELILVEWALSPPQRNARQGHPFHVSLVKAPHPSAMRPYLGVVTCLERHTWALPTLLFLWT